MTVTVEEVEFLKKAFLSSPNFEFCKLTFIFMDDIPSIFRALGTHSFINHDYIGRARRRWFFRSDDSEKVLSIEVYSDFIEFENIDWVEVPVGAVVV
ncbi:hypothetical protein CRE_23315 [Caenorhabditis remanei]|uniref:DUF38 domain-containing protein n=1 Tax=Caenorhabditis remanei TaxID=31234 RepID=E3MGQ1_CAERE|nr:hypothetical protein CRE_23315 [Caenorhabditis remanei]